MHRSTPRPRSFHIRRASLFAVAFSLIAAIPVAHASSQALVDAKGMPILFANPTQLSTAGGSQVAAARQMASARTLSSAIVAPQREPNDRFGASLDRAGNTLAVGAWGSFDGEGVAYVSTLEDSGWSAPVELAAPTESLDNFGWSVATDGTSIAVGARLASEPDSVDEPLVETGAITFFERGAEGFEVTQRFYSSGRDEAAAFGFSMAMQNGVALVGEPGADDAVRGFNETGAAYIFTRNAAGRWSESQRLVAPDAASEDVFGLRVALSQLGNRSYAFVAALGRDDRGSASGSVYVFERDAPGASFVFRQKLLASDGAAQDQFGFSISAYEDRLVVGAPGVNSPSVQDAGAVYVFERGASQWSQRAKVVAGAADQQDRFGYQVALDASGFAASRFPNVAVAGTSRDVSVYKRISSSEYRQEALFSPPSVGGNQSFGGALSYQDGVLLVGMESAVTDGVSAGSVEVFEPGASPAAPLGGILGLGGLGLGLLALGRRRASQRALEV